jgi:heme/copper-type cytochrome/quinol oxidase subunit 2
MKRKVFGVLNIIVGVFQIIYLLLQNGTIRINAFIVDHRYTESFDKFMNVFMWILSISIIVLLIFIISSYFKRKKENLNNTGEVLIIGSHIISIIGFAFMGMATILSPLSIVGGFMLLSKSN